MLGPVGWGGGDGCRQTDTFMEMGPRPCREKGIGIHWGEGLSGLSRGEVGRGQEALGCGVGVRFYRSLKDNWRGAMTG